MARRSTYEKEIHFHIWKDSYNDSEKKCYCGSIQLSKLEFERRKEEWLGYYAKVRESFSYKRFIEQKELYRAGDMVSVKELAEEAKEELRTKTDWIMRPKFPDITWSNYVVKENEAEQTRIREATEI